MDCLNVFFFASLKSSVKMKSCFRSSHLKREAIRAGDEQCEGGEKI